MKDSSFLLGMGQMRVEGGEIGANLDRAQSMIEQAADRGCRVIVLPECLDAGWTFPGARSLAQPIPGRSSDRLCAAARKSGLHVVAGLTESLDGRIYNAAILISPQGEILLKHHKINILDIAQDLYSTGRSLAAVQTGLGVLGIDICADNFSSSHVLGHALARMGAQIILSPSAWAVPADRELDCTPPVTQMWIDSYQTLARLYDLTIVGVSNVGWLQAGPWKGYKCIGGSLAVGPGGKILAQGAQGETAEELRLVQVSPVEPTVTGTKFPEMLWKRGYQGP